MTFSILIHLEPYLSGRTADCPFPGLYSEEKIILPRFNLTIPRSVNWLSIGMGEPILSRTRNDCWLISTLKNLDFLSRLSGSKLLIEYEDLIWADCRCSVKKGGFVSYTLEHLMMRGVFQNSEGNSLFPSIGPDSPIGGYNLVPQSQEEWLLPAVAQQPAIIGIVSEYHLTPEGIIEPYPFLDFGRPNHFVNAVGYDDEFIIILDGDRVLKVRRDYGRTLLGTRSILSRAYLPSLPCVSDTRFNTVLRWLDATTDYSNLLAFTKKDYISILSNPDTPPELLKLLLEDHAEEYTNQEMVQLGIIRKPERMGCCACQDVRRVPLLVGGKFMESEASKSIDVINPATLEVVSQVPLTRKEEFQAAVNAAKLAFPSWRNTPVTTRQHIMLKFQELIWRDMDKLALIIATEQGKTLKDAQGDVYRCLEVVEHVCRMGTLQMGDYVFSVSNGFDTYSIREPLGVCAGICFRNFPAMIPLRMFTVAVTCGNTFILKTPEKNPGAFIMLAELAMEAGLPDGVLNVVHGTNDIVNAICDDDAIRAVSFVGSNNAKKGICKLIQSGVEAGGKLVLDGRNIVDPLFSVISGLTWSARRRKSLGQCYLACRLTVLEQAIEIVNENK